MRVPNIVLWEEIDIVSPLRQKAVEEYQKRNPETVLWTPEQLKGLVIQTETRWARAVVDEAIFVVNENGRNSEHDLSQKALCACSAPMKEYDRLRVNLYAFPSHSEKDARRPPHLAPFCSVFLTLEQVRRIPVKEREGKPIQIQLADFLADRLPNRAACIRELNSMVSEYKEIARERRRVQRAKAAESQTVAYLPPPTQSRSSYLG